MSGYQLGRAIFGGLAFVVSWIYAIATYGFFLGVGLGWIPASIIGMVVGALWPVAAIAIAGVALLFIADSKGPMASSVAHSSSVHGSVFTDRERTCRNGYPVADSIQPALVHSVAKMRRRGASASDIYQYLTNEKHLNVVAHTDVEVPPHQLWEMMHSAGCSDTLATSYVEIVTGVPTAIHRVRAQHRPQRLSDVPTVTLGDSAPPEIARSLATERLPGSSAIGISSEDERRIGATCEVTGQALGPGAYNACVSERRKQLQNNPLPSFAGVAADDRSAIESACRITGTALGPGAYNSCIADKIGELRRNPAPSFDGINASNRRWIESSCQITGQALGPGAYNSCLSQRIQELLNNPKR